MSKGLVTFCHKMSATLPVWSVIVTEDFQVPASTGSVFDTEDFRQALVPYLTRKISKSVDTRMLAGDQPLQSADRTLPACCHKVISIHAIAEFVIALLYLL